MKRKFNYAINSLLIIYLMGVDGSGKTTLSARIAEYFLRRGIEVKVIWFGFKEFRFFYIAKFIKKLIGEKRANNMFAYYLNDRTSVLNIKKVMDLMFFLIVIMDYLIWYLIIIRKFKNQVIVADRYVYDIFISIATHYKNEKILYILYKILNRIIIKPTVVFFIKIPLLISVKRKPEKPLEYLKLQENYYKILNYLLYKDNCDIFTVDGQKALETLVVNIINIVYRYL